MRGKITLQYKLHWRIAEQVKKIEKLFWQYGYEMEPSYSTSTNFLDTLLLQLIKGIHLALCLKDFERR